MAFDLTRRTAIKGLTLGAGASVLGPLLSHLAAHAAGAPSAVRQRFVFVLQSNGMNPNHIIPAGLPTRKDAELFTNEDTVETPLADGPRQFGQFSARRIGAVDRKTPAATRASFIVRSIIVWAKVRTRCSAAV